MHLKYVADALSKIFGNLFSHDEIVVKDISVDMVRQPTLYKYLPAVEEKPPLPREVISTAVTVKVKLQETLDLDSLTRLAESIKEAGLKASLTAGDQL